MGLRFDCCCDKIVYMVYARYFFLLLFFHMRRNENGEPRERISLSNFSFLPNKAK